MPEAVNSITRVLSTYLAPRACRAPGSPPECAWIVSVVKALHPKPQLRGGKQRGSWGQNKEAGRSPSAQSICISFPPDVNGESCFSHQGWEQLPGERDAPAVRPGAIGMGGRDRDTPK